MDYITVKEAGEKWGVSGRAITYHIIEGRIPGAVKKAQKMHPSQSRGMSMKKITGDKLPGITLLWSRSGVKR